jgi:hypothetical protein
VDTLAEANDAAIATLRADLYGLGCPNGILFDARRCVIMRDTFENMDETGIQVDADVLTEAVLARAGGGSLDERVGRWLRMLSANWDGALPEEPSDAAPFIADIVPAASGSNVHTLGPGH